MDRWSPIAGNDEVNIPKIEGHHHFPIFGEHANVLLLIISVGEVKTGIKPPLLDGVGEDLVDTLVVVGCKCSFDLLD